MSISSKHNKLIIIHRDLSNLKTGGHHYLANTIWYLKKKNLNMEIVDCGAFPKKVKQNRLLFGIHILKHYLKYRKGIFSFTNHNLYFYLLIPYFFNRIKGNKYGCGCHLTQYNLRKNIFMRCIEFFCEYLFLQGASLLIIPSKAALRQFKIFHLGRKKTVIITPAPNVIGPARVPSCRRLEKLVFTGHVVWRKGLDVLVRAFAQLKDLQLHLDVAGLYDDHSNYYQKINRLIDASGLRNSILFHGYLSPKHLASLYQNADLFVFPSRHETYGMVLIEAMSFGLPVVASSIHTTVEIIKDRVNGILYETEDADACANAIRELAFNSDLRYSIIRNNCRLSRKTRNWEDVGRENLSALCPLLNE